MTTRSQPMLAVRYTHLNIDEALAQLKSQIKTSRFKANEALLAEARTRDSAQALSKLTTLVDGQRRLTSTPPLIVPLEEVFAEIDAEALYEMIRGLIAKYRRTLQIDRRHLQATGDIFLGWQRTRGPDGKDRYYVRQLRDWKASAEIEQMVPSSMAVYGRLCGLTLARAHARSGDRIAISSYLGNSDKFDNAIADFAETYADQNELDYAALQAAVASGRAEAPAGL